MIRHLRAWYWATVTWCRIDGACYCCRRIWFGLVGILKFYLRLGKRAAPEIIAARNRACGRCIIFDHELKTCGHARRPEMWFNPKRNEVEPLGCLCTTDIKNTLQDSNCWAWASNHPNIKGWEQTLNWDFRDQ